MATILYRSEIGQVGVKPGVIKMTSSDNLATITAPGYLNGIGNQLSSLNISPSDIIYCFYSFNELTGAGTYAELSVSISNGVITLVNTTPTANDVITTYSPANYTPDASGGTSPVNSVAAHLHGISNALGLIGNYLNQYTLEADAVTLVSNTPANIIVPFIQPLPPGEWDVTGTVVFEPNAATTSSSFIAAISPTSATLPPVGAQNNTSQINATFSAGQFVILTVGPVRYSNGLFIDHAYLVAQSTFAVNSMKAYGCLTAVRTYKA